jgi:hypothetical protein
LRAQIRNLDVAIIKKSAGVMNGYYEKIPREILTKIGSYYYGIEH